MHRRLPGTLHKDLLVMSQNDSTLPGAVATVSRAFEPVWTQPQTGAHPRCW